MRQLVRGMTYMAIDFSDVAEPPLQSAPTGRPKIDFSDVAEPVAAPSRKDAILSALAIPQSNTVGAIRSFGRGASLGLSDTVGEAINAGINSRITGTPFLQQFAADKNQANAEREQFRADNPKLAYGSEIAGALTPAIITSGIASGMASPYTTGTMAAEAASTPLAAAKGALSLMKDRALVAGAQGALYGANEAESSNALGGAITGAEIGGALGAATVPIGAAANALIDKAVIPAYQNIANRVTKTSEEKARGYVQKILESSGMTPEQVAAKIKEYGDDAALSDVATGFRRAEKLASNYFNPNRDAANEALRARQGGQYSETMDILSRAFGGIKRDDVNKVLEANAAEMATKASPLYAKALASDVPESVMLKKLEQVKPFIDAAKRSGDYSADVDNVVMQPVYDAVGMKTGEKAVARKLTNAEQLHNTKQGLYALESKAYANGDNAYGAKITKAREELTKELDKLPGYAEARQVWAGGEANKAAADIGTRIDTMPASEFTAAINSMSESEKQHALYGAMNKIGTRVGQKADVQNTAGMMIRNPEIREKLSALVGKDQLEELVKNSAKWDAYTARKNLITTGNVTHEMQMAEDGMDGIVNMLNSHPKIVMAKGAIQSLLSPYALTKDTATEIGRVVGRDKWQPDELVNYLTAPQQTQGQLRQIAGNALSGETALAPNELIIDMAREVKKKKAK